MSAATRLVTALCALACATAAASAGAQEIDLPPPGTASPPTASPPTPATPPPAAHPRAAAHPAQVTGWARPRASGQSLRGGPNPALPERLTVPSGIAGRVLSVVTGEDGATWVRVLFPNRTGGWVPGEAVLAAPAPATLSASTRASLESARTALGPRSAVVVRDPLGRTLFSAGTPRPLSLASVTKLATMAAALQSFPVSAATASAVLGSSSNALAQRLSTRLGAGSRSRGALMTRRAIESPAGRWALVDGSGLSPNNRATADSVADLLLRMREQEGFPTLVRGLPLAGRTGTLAGRMRSTSAFGRVRAKTGTLFSTPVSSLAGYAWPAGAGLAPRRALVVVIIANGVAPVRAPPQQDAIMVALTAPGALEGPLR